MELGNDCYSTHFYYTFTMSRIGKYLNATAAEMKQVKWPTTKQAIIYTALVIGISVFVALFVAAFDKVFTNLLNLFI